MTFSVDLVIICFVALTFRRNIGQNITHKEVRLTGYVAANQKDCFIYIGEASRIESLQSVFMNFERDFDVLEESLGLFQHTFKRQVTNQSNVRCCFCSGAVSSPYYLVSDHYIPDRMLKKIDRTTSAMMENGLNQFFSAFTEFKRKLVARANLNIADEDDFQALSIDQLKKPVILMVGFCGIAVIIFIVEVIIFKVKQRNRRSRS